MASGVRWGDLEQQQRSLSDLCGATGAETVTFTATDDCETPPARRPRSPSRTRPTRASTLPRLTRRSSVMVPAMPPPSPPGSQQWRGRGQRCGGVTWSHSNAGLSDLCGATGADGHLHGDRRLRKHLQHHGHVPSRTRPIRSSRPRLQRDCGMRRCRQHGGLQCVPATVGPPLERKCVARPPGATTAPA